MFEKYLNKDELIKNLQELIKIPSVHAESNVPSEPFGKNTVRELEYVLNLGKSLGFSPDADFPCIYAEKGLISPFLIMDYSSF